MTFSFSFIGLNPYFCIMSETSLSFYKGVISWMLFAPSWTADMISWSFTPCISRELEGTRQMSSITFGSVSLRAFMESYFVFACSAIWGYFSMTFCMMKSLDAWVSNEIASNRFWALSEINSMMGYPACILT